MNKIKIYNFINEPKQTFFAPEYNYYIAEAFIKDINFKNLSNFLLKKEKEILKLPVTNKNIKDGYTGLGKNSTTARHTEYNVLNFKNKEIKKIEKNIVFFHNEFLKGLHLPIPNELYIQCWVNIMKKGEKINPHLHDISPNCYLGGHICIQCNDTSTYYLNPLDQINEPSTFKSKNEVGKITLFQQYITHYTDVHKSNKERITIAFDLTIKKPTTDNYLRLI